MINYKFCFLNLCMSAHEIQLRVSFFMYTITPSKVRSQDAPKALLRRGNPYTNFGVHELSRDVLVICGDNAHRGKMVERQKAQLLLNYLCDGR